MVDCILIYKPPLADRKFLLTSCLNLLHCGFPLILVSPILSSLPLLWITFQIFECYPLSCLFYGLKVSSIQPFLTRFYFWPPLHHLGSSSVNLPVSYHPKYSKWPWPGQGRMDELLSIVWNVSTINATKLLLTSH